MKCVDFYHKLTPPTFSLTIFEVVIFRPFAADIGSLVSNNP